MVQRYQKRLICPMLDRIDLHVEVPRVEYDKPPMLRRIALS